MLQHFLDNKKEISPQMNWSVLFSMEKTDTQKKTKAGERNEKYSLEIIWIIFSSFFLLSRFIIFICILYLLFTWQAPFQQWRSCVLAPQPWNKCTTFYGFTLLRMMITIMNIYIFSFSLHFSSPLLLLLLVIHLISELSWSYGSHIVRTCKLRVSERERYNV